MSGLIPLEFYFWKFRALKDNGKMPGFGAHLGVAASIIPNYGVMPMPSLGLDFPKINPARAKVTTWTVTFMVFPGSYFLATASIGANFM